MDNKSLAAQATAILEEIAELVHQRNRLHRSARFAAQLAARIVYLKRCGRWLLAEQEREHRAALNELRDMHNALRAEHGLPPIIRLGFVAHYGEHKGAMVYQWGTLEYNQGNSVLVADGTGMWQQQRCTCLVPLKTPATGTRCAGCAGLLPELAGVADGQLPESYRRDDDDRPRGGGSGQGITADGAYYASGGQGGAGNWPRGVDFGVSGQPTDEPGATYPSPGTVPDTD